MRRWTASRPASKPDAPSVGEDTGPGNIAMLRASFESHWCHQVRPPWDELFAVAEAYPDPKANQNMLALQEELSSTENKIAFARQAYNDAVMTYNTKREVFPTTIIAGMFNFQEAGLFEVEQAGEREAPKVSF